MTHLEAFFGTTTGEACRICCCQNLGIADEHIKGSSALPVQCQIPGMQPYSILGIECPHWTEAAQANGCLAVASLSVREGLFTTPVAWFAA